MRARTSLIDQGAKRIGVLIIAIISLTMAALAQALPANRSAADVHAGFYGANGTYRVVETRLGPARGGLQGRVPSQIAPATEPSGLATADKPQAYVKEYETSNTSGNLTLCCFKVKVVMVNGKPGPEYSEILHLSVSPDGKRTAYVGYRVSGSWIVVDGTPVATYDGGVADLIFSPDSQHVAYASTDGSRWSVVVDGRAGPEYCYFNKGSLIFSPDSQHVAYGAWTSPQDPKCEMGSKQKQLVVLDDKPSASYDQVGNPIFNAEGLLEFLAERGNFRYRVKYVSIQ